MLNSKLLSRSLSTLYREVLFSPEEQNSTDVKREIRRLAADPSLFSLEEINQNKETLENIEHIAEHNLFVCETDASVQVWYDKPEERIGKNINGGCAYVISQDNKPIIEDYFQIPDQYKGTDINSHIAEYQAIISCLRVLSIYHTEPENVEVVLYTDSRIIAGQMNYRYSARKESLVELREEALSYTRKFRKVDIIHRPRTHNGRANYLSRKSIQAETPK